MWAQQVSYIKVYGNSLSVVTTGRDLWYHNISSNLYITMAAMSLWDGGGVQQLYFFFIYFGLMLATRMNIFLFLFGLWHEICGHK